MLRDHERVTLRASGFVACALTADRLRSWFGCGSASGIQARPSHQSPSRISIKHDTRHDTRQCSRRVTTIDDAGTRRDRTLVVAACTFRSVFTLLPVSYILVQTPDRTFGVGSGGGLTCTSPPPRAVALASRLSLAGLRLSRVAARPVARRRSPERRPGRRAADGVW